MHDRQQAAALTIEQQHTAIIACCDELLTLLHAPTPAGDVGKVRMRLAGLLQANLASEEAQLLAPIRRLAPAERPRSYAELNEEAADLRGRYSEHVGRWTATMIGDDRAGYARAAATLVHQVKAHLVRKGTVLPEWRRVSGQGG